MFINFLLSSSSFLYNLATTTTNLSWNSWIELDVVTYSITNDLNMILIATNQSNLGSGLCPVKKRNIQTTVIHHLS